MLGTGGAALILTVALAQGMMGGSGNQNGSGMMGMQDQMQQMTEQCNRMMQGMQGMMGMMGGGMMGGGMMGGGMMDRGTSSGYSQQDAEALARAFLAGHAPDADITQVERNNTYVVHFQNDGTEGTLHVDAETGTVQLVQNN